MEESDAHSPKLEVKSTKMLPPPTENFFQSREELLKHVRDFAMTQGYMISIKRSDKEKRVILGCDRGGTYRSRLSAAQSNRQRKTSTRLISCPFELQGIRMSEGIWVLKVKKADHNHPPSEDVSAHPFCRRFSEEEVVQIKEMNAAGIRPRQILTTLRQSNPNLKAISMDVYNIKGKIRRENRSGRSPIQALLDELAHCGFLYYFQCDEEGQLTHLFFAHPISVVLSKSYSNVFIMDCSYKTNKYKMPLLDIVGVTSFNTSFFSCFIFLSKEEEEDYVWALKMFEAMLGGGAGHSQPAVIVSDREVALMRAMRVVFPATANLLCVWRIEKDIVSNCKPHFKDGDNWSGFLSSWTNLINSPTEIAYHEAWRAFQTQFNEKMVALNYIASTWLPFKEYFIKAWTEKHLHFGNRVTSRAKGAHSMLKSHLQFSVGDLQVVKNKICLATEMQFQEIKTRLSMERIRIPHDLRIPFFNELVTHVSIFALRELFKQYQLARSNPSWSVCMNQFTTTMGLPCAHRMKSRMDENQVMHLSDIHLQWRIDHRSFNNIEAGLNNQEERHQQQEHLVQQERPQNQLSQLVETVTPFIQEPSVLRPRGRPPKSKEKRTNSSTSKDHSASDSEKKSGKCSFCKGVGHNNRTCQLKVTAIASKFPMIYAHPFGTK
ncbi:PKS-NRPS hybrid synthetase CHGG_01239 [Amborella trichopoda]|uniref:MULE transposase domain-containing protein n=1 Tax=Amborella trichopoda TaxID=13333 RepID=W1P7C7_AMBTC|nr:PKS-NRPS hybrid synthetase CHGG_01239 [Amborella trichopoda]ERN03501.1 hypothetical protein AMTR_s00003p00269970 [Amborella trichopoda]|eukprot:XP_006841826.1 PKS-NRPS hybrid synthetase CHGG_01239 [Amborella trichopoda]